MSVSFNLNGKAVTSRAEPDTPLLWVVRDELGLTGTKFGCGLAQCGACTVHLDGTAARSCQTPVADAAGVAVTTIEGLSADGMHPVQVAWREINVPQCGYCQVGMIMAVAAMLKKTPKPTDADIDNEITNICRCGTYNRVRSAIHQAAGAAPAGRTRT